MTITVTDQAPTCNDTSTTTTVGKAVDISNLFDCEDADGDPITIYFGDGEYGVTDANGTTYTPDPGFVGTDQVLFQADDGALRSPIRAITVRVTASPPPPPPPPPPAPPVVVTPKDTSPPVFSLTHPQQKLGDVRSHGIKLVETSNEPGTLKVTITVDKRTARSLKIKPKAKRTGHHRHPHADGRRRETEPHHQADDQRAQGAQTRSQAEMPGNGEVGRCRRKCHDAHHDADTEAIGGCTARPKQRV